jgi:hypothetical protein
MPDQHPCRHHEGMSVQVAEQGIDAQALAEAQVQRRLVVQLAAAGAVVATWQQLNPATLFADWVAGAGSRIFAALSLAQEAIAAMAPSFVEDVLLLTGDDVFGAALDPLAFAGRSFDVDADLRDVLRIAPARVTALLRSGVSEPVALERGQRFLEMVTMTETADAGRAADQVALIGAEPADPGKVWNYGWVRVIEPGACSRCAILAGRFYKWNEGFERHPACRCIHVPSRVATAGSLASDPRAYFNSLSLAERNRLFGKAVSEAIEAGGDMNRIVNAATKGKVWIAGDGTRTKSGRRTPWQLIKDAAGDRAEATRLLRQFGYIRA